MHPARALSEAQTFRDKISDLFGLQEMSPLPPDDVSVSQLDDVMPEETSKTKTPANNSEKGKLTSTSAAPALEDTAARGGD
jgi:hypothetical protein